MQAGRNKNLLQTCQKEKERTFNTFDVFVPRTRCPRKCCPPFVRRFLLKCFFAY